jgi:hypothetical protein
MAAPRTPRRLKIAAQPSFSASHSVVAAKQLALPRNLRASNPLPAHGSAFTVESELTAPRSSVKVFSPGLRQFVEALGTPDEGLAFAGY